MNEIERHLICSSIRKIKEFLDIRMSTVPEVQFNTILIKVSKIIFTEIEKKSENSDKFIQDSNTQKSFCCCCCFNF